jgi:hypothetical protein
VGDPIPVQMGSVNRLTGRVGFTTLTSFVADSRAFLTATSLAAQRSEST